MTPQELENVQLQPEDFSVELGQLHLALVVERRRVKMLLAENERLVAENQALKEAES